MNEQKQLSKALEIQEMVFELQREVQMLVRMLAVGNSVQVSTAKSDPDLIQQGSNKKPGLTLFDIENGDYRYTKPSVVFLPDGSQEAVRSWKDVVLSIVGWMITSGRIKTAVPSGGRRRHPIVSQRASDLSQTHGNPASYLAQANGWWVDTWGNVNTKARNLIAICKDTDTDPSNFRVVIR